MTKKKNPKERAIKSTVPDTKSQKIEAKCSLSKEGIGICEKPS